MTKDIPERMSNSQFAHIKFFIVFTVSYFLADNITLILNQIAQGLFEVLGRLFQELTLPLFVVVLTLILARLQLSLIPELSISEKIPIYIAIIPPIIVSHPFMISFSGSTLTAIWFVLDIFAEDRQFIWMLEVIIYAFSGYAIFMIQYRSKTRSSRVSQILRYLGKEIFIASIVIFSSVYLVLSFINGNFESLTLTMPVKLILVFLFAFATLPIPRKNGKEEIEDLDKEDIRNDLNEN